MKSYLIIFALCISSIVVAAQMPSDSTTFLLPDGTVLKSEKLDSLTKAWGRVLFVHSKEDDARGIIHLERITDEIRRQLEDEDSKRKKAIASMLNKPAPAFEAKDLKGNNWSLNNLRGKIVVLNFWFTSCTPCIREMPELNMLVSEYEGKDVIFLGLTYNNADQVKSFLERRSFSYTVVPDSHEIDKIYQVSSWPTSIVIDRKGYVKMIVNSHPKIREELDAAIKSIK
ncbi:MAG: TlpA disulfide reductase family protein [Chitinophagaceae bacterium]